MSEPFLGEIRMFGGNFAPRGWALCNGQLLPISQNTALFSILGTTYGGNGQTTFGLPNLQSASPVHAGTGPGLSPIVLGQTGGHESFTLTQNQMPQHTHVLNCNSGEGALPSAQSNFPATANDGNRNDYPSYSATPNATMAPAVVGAAGGSQPVACRSPYLAVNFIIALQGIFPSRN